MTLGPAPALRHLRREANRASLVRLRAAVAPILGNNLLPHFTDHSVAHSDSVAELVDHLGGPLQSGQQPLTDPELTILYSARYLHDIGMQYENAGDTEAIRGSPL